jgi:hypothetical protein
MTRAHNIGRGVAARATEGRSPSLHAPGHPTGLPSNAHPSGSGPPQPCASHRANPAGPPHRGSAGRLHVSRPDSIPITAASRCGLAHCAISSLSRRSTAPAPPAFRRRATDETFFNRRRPAPSLIPNHLPHTGHGLTQSLRYHISGSRPHPPSERTGRRKPRKMIFTEQSQIYSNLPGISRLRRPSHPPRKVIY